MPGSSLRLFGDLSASDDISLGFLLHVSPDGLIPGSGRPCRSETLSRLRSFGTRPINIVTFFNDKLNFVAS